MEVLPSKKIKKDLVSFSTKRRRRMKRCDQMTLLTINLQKAKSKRELVVKELKLWLIIGPT